jgi:hypothetical protein
MNRLDRATKASETVRNTHLDFVDFWSDVISGMTVLSGAADLPTSPFTVTVEDMPDGVSIIRAISSLKVRAIKDTSAAENYLTAGKFRGMKSGGTWGVDDVVAIDFVDGQWNVDASTKEGGDVVVGDNNIASIVDGNGEYYFHFDETARGDAIKALATGLVFYDMQAGLRVYFR